MASVRVSPCHGHPAGERDPGARIRQRRVKLHRLAVALRASNDVREVGLEGRPAARDDERLRPSAVQQGLVIRPLRRSRGKVNWEF